MPLQAAIFDFNGVLVDDEPVHLQLFQEIFTARGLSLTESEYFQRYFVFDDAGVFRQYFADRGRPLTPADLAALCAEKARLYAALPDSRFTFFEGSEALARDAARAVPLAIASGARGAEIARHLASRKLAPLFRAVVSIDDVPNGKPDPAVYLEAARRLGVDPRACVAIEDSPGGLVSAKAAGMKRIAVTHSVARDRLEAELVFDTLEGVTWASLVARLAAPNADGKPRQR